MSGTTPGQYFRLFWKRFFSDLKFGRDRLWALLPAVAIVFLQAQRGLLNQKNVWLLLVIIAQVYGILIALWLVWKILVTQWHLYRDEESSHTRTLSEMRARHDEESGILRSQNAEMREQLQTPKLVPEITIKCIQVLQGVFVPNVPQTCDMAYWVSVHIGNDHRVDTTAACLMEFRDPQGALFETDSPGNPERRSYPDIDLNTPIKFSCPRVGHLYCLVKNRTQEQVKGCSLVLSVTDGTGVVSVAEALIP
jgi:hypothetical protein